MAKKDKKDKKKNKDKELLVDAPPDAGMEEVLDEPEFDISEPMKRLNRVAGQIEGIQKMLRKSRSLDEILMQCKAAHSALRAAEIQILEHYLIVAVDDIAHASGKKNREEKIRELMELYRPF